MMNQPTQTSLLHKDQRGPRYKATSVLKRVLTSVRSKEHRRLTLFVALVTVTIQVQLVYLIAHTHRKQKQRKLREWLGALVLLTVLMFRHVMVSLDEFGKELADIPRATFSDDLWCAFVVRFVIFYKITVQNLFLFAVSWSLLHSKTMSYLGLVLYIVSLQFILSLETLMDEALDYIIPYMRSPTITTDDDDLLSYFADDMATIALGVLTSAVTALASFVLVPVLPFIGFVVVFCTLAGIGLTLQVCEFCKNGRQRNGVVEP